MKWQYFKIKEENQGYKGLRYFRWMPSNPNVLQICVSTGEERKGRNATPGLYYIHSSTFLCNYLGMNYCEPVKKKEFDKYCNVVYKTITA